MGKIDLHWGNDSTSPIRHATSYKAGCQSCLGRTRVKRVEHGDMGACRVYTHNKTTTLLVSIICKK